MKWMHSGIFIVGIAMGGLLVYGIFMGKSAFVAQSVSTKDYQYLAKRISVEDPNDVLIAFNPLRKNLRDLIKPWKSSFAFYFEYLPTGVSIGVNEKNEYSLRSLIKLPIVMSYYLYNERSGMSIDTTVRIKKNELDDRFGTLWQKGEGAEISLSEAARLALIESDNTAIGVLADYVPVADYQEVYEGLDIEYPSNPENIQLGAKQYSSILKALYFSSILSNEHSQEILMYLTKTPFNDKLAAPIPKHIPVAHKIGVFENEQFQDCGIVYYPKRQYILCMISQSSEDEARRRMVLVSKTIFDYIDAVNKK